MTTWNTHTQYITNSNNKKDVIPLRDSKENNVEKH